MKNHNKYMIPAVICAFSIIAFCAACGSKTTTAEPTTPESTTTTIESTTPEPTSPEPTTPEPTTPEPVTLEQAVSETAAVTRNDYGYSDLPQIRIKATNITKEYSDATVTIYDPSGKYGLAENVPVSVRIRGNISALCDKKPYNLKFASDTSLLGMIKGKKWILLANRFDKSLMRNKLVYDFSSQLSFAYNVQSQYVDVWVNNVYKGNYLMTTPIDVAENKIDIDPENNEFLIERELSRKESGVKYITTPVKKVRYQINEPSKITEEQTAYLLKILGDAETAIAEKDFEAIQKYIDVQTFIDFYIVQELFRNQDVNFSSSRLYVKGDKIYAGPVWDFDICCGNGRHSIYGKYCNISYGVFALSTPWIKELLLVPEFKELFVARYNELQDLIVNLYANNSLGSNRIDVLQSKYKAAFLRDSKVAGWGFITMGLDDVPFQTYNEYVEYLRNWLKERNTWLLKYLNKL